MRVEYDADAGTMVYYVNDVSQGVCFTGLQGVELFPAVAFYSSGRSASIVSLRLLGVAPAAAPAAQAAATTAASTVTVPIVSASATTTPVVAVEAAPAAVVGCPRCCRCRDSSLPELVLVVFCQVACMGGLFADSCTAGRACAGRPGRLRTYCIFPMCFNRSMHPSPCASHYPRMNVAALLFGARVVPEMRSRR